MHHKRLKGLHDHKIAASPMGAVDDWCEHIVTTVVYGYWQLIDWMQTMIVILLKNRLYPLAYWGIE
jgi:hypothetical protein